METSNHLTFYDFVVCLLTSLPLDFCGLQVHRKPDVSHLPDEPRTPYEIVSVALGFQRKKLPEIYQVFSSLRTHNRKFHEGAIGIENVSFVANVNERQQVLNWS